MGSTGDDSTNPGQAGGSDAEVPATEPAGPHPDATVIADAGATALLPGSRPGGDDQTVAGLAEGAGDDETIGSQSGETTDGPAGIAFGDYVIERELGRGGMGVVYRARQVSLNRSVALKMVRGGLLADSDEARRFQNEAEAVAALDHPHIVPIYEVGAHEGQRYFTMKLVPGGSLVDQMPRFQSDPDAAARLVATAAEAIHHAHQRGILHRDLKPANILVDDNLMPYVTDFGLARKIEGDSDLTMSGAIVGTPAYMSPEQASGNRRAVTTATDIYGLGGILYALLTGRAPCQGDTLAETLDRVRNRPPDPPSSVNAKVPRDLEVICLKSLDKDPSRRYATALELAEDLRRYLAGEAIRARRVGGLERAWRWSRANPLVASLAGLLAIGVVGVAIGSSWAAVSYRDLAGRERRAAGSERAQRERADDLAGRAQRAVVEAERLRKVAEAQSTENRKRLVGRLLSSGVDLLERGDLLGASPWFAEALAIDADHRDRAPMHRRRLGATFAQAPRVVHAAFLPATAVMPELAPNGSTIVMADDGSVTFVDLLTGRRESFAPDVPRPVRRFLATRDGKFAACLTSRGEPGAPGGQSSELSVWDVLGRRPLGLRLTRNGPIGEFALSDDGARLAVVDLAPGRPGPPAGAGPVRVYDTRSGREACAPLETGARPVRLTFAPGGRRLIAEMFRIVRLVQPESLVRVWDADSGRPLSPPMKHAGAVASWELSGDGSRLVTVTRSSPSVQGEARVWDVASGRSIAGPFDHGAGGYGMIVNATLSPDGRLLAAGGLREIRLWNIPAGTLAGRPLPYGPNESLAFSADGRLLAATGGLDHAARVWDVATRTEVLPPLPHGVASFSPDTRLLLTVGRDAETGDAEVRAWDLTRTVAPWLTDQTFPGQRLWEIPGGRGVVVLADEARQPGRFIPGPARSTLQLLDRRTTRPLSAPLEVPTGGTVIDVAVANAPRRAVVGLQTRPAMPTMPMRPGNPPMRPARPGEGRSPGLLLACDFAGKDQPREPVTIPVPRPITFVAIAPDGRHAAAVVHDRPSMQDWQRFDTTGVWLCDLAARRGALLPLRAGARVVLADFSPDGRRLLTVQPGFAQLWDVETGQAVGPAIEDPLVSKSDLENQIVSGQGQARCAAYSGDGRRLAVGTGGSRVHQLDVATGCPAGPVLKTGAGVVAVRFSQDGRRIIAATSAAARVWDADAGQALTPPLVLARTEAIQASALEMTETIQDVGLSRDGRLAATAGMATLRIWETDTGAPLSPPIRLQSFARLRWRPDGRLEVLDRRERSIRVLDLAPDDRPVAELRDLAQLLSGRRIDDLAGAVPAGLPEQQTAWSSLKERCAELPGRPAVPADRWHARQAAEAERDWRWYAAVVHLDALVAAAPDDPAFRRRRAEVLARLGRFDRAAEDLKRLGPNDLNHPDVQEAIAVISAWLHDDRAHQAIGARLSGLLRFDSRSERGWLLVLSPGDGAGARAALGLAEMRLKTTPGDPGWLAVRGAARYRAGDLAGAEGDLKESVAAYGRKLRGIPRFGGRNESVVTDAAQVTPACNEGTPREWVLLAMVEQRRGRHAVARAWLAKAAGWLELAQRDPPDPATLGGLSDPSTRSMLQMSPIATMRPDLFGPGGFARTFGEPYVGTWRQLLALRVLVRDASELIDTEDELPEDVFAR